MNVSTRWTDTEGDDDKRQGEAHRSTFGPSSPMAECYYQISAVLLGPYGVNTHTHKHADTR